MPCPKTFQSLKRLSPSQIVSNDKNFDALASYGRSRVLVDSAANLLEWETLIRCLYYRLDDQVTDEERDKLVERVLLPLMDNPAWRESYDNTRGVGRGRGIIAQLSPEARDIGISIYILEDYIARKES